MTVPPAAAGSTEPPVTYVAGTWVALVVDDLALIADLPPDSRLLGPCWTAALTGQGLDAVLSALAGPQGATSFAGVVRTPESTRLVVAGTASADVAGTAVAGDAESPREQRFAGRLPVRLRAGAGATGGERVELPLVRGIAKAGAVGVGVAAAEQQAQPAQPARPAEPVPVPRVSTDTMPPSSVYDSGIIESLPWRGTNDDPFARPAAEATPPPPPPAASAAPARGDPFGGAAQYSHNPWAPAPGAQPAWPEPAAPPPAPTPAPPPAPAAAQSPEQAASPWAPGGSPAAPTPKPPAREESTGTRGTVVHAFACPNGHVNPPYGGTCRICDEPLPHQEGFPAPRPSLGVLKLSTGDTVPLDRDVVLGRAPFHADENAASRPHLVQLSSPGNDVSRSHVRVNLENWFVQVTDLGSTNGTVVTLPDQAPVRLRPHDPFTIVPGTSVNIADEITVRFEIT